MITICTLVSAGQQLPGKWVKTGMAYNMTYFVNTDSIQLTKIGTRMVESLTVTLEKPKNNSEVGYTKYLIQVNCDSHEMSIMASIKYNYEDKILETDNEASEWFEPNENSQGVALINLTCKAK